LSASRASRRAFGNLREGLVSWREDGEWSGTLEGLDQAGSLDCGNQRIEAASANRGVDNILLVGVGDDGASPSVAKATAIIIADILILLNISFSCLILRLNYNIFLSGSLLPDNYAEPDIAVTNLMLHRLEHKYDTVQLLSRY
jgi:hypothetical protein